MQPSAFIATLTLLVALATTQRLHAQQAAPPNCAASHACAEEGLCTAWRGQCVAASVEGCRRSRPCKIGYCTPHKGQCIVGSGEDCLWSEGCRKKGWCTAQAGECVAYFPEDCRQAEVCKSAGKCDLDHTGSCEARESHETKTTGEVGMLAGGIVMTVVGVAGFIGGIVWGFESLDCKADGPLALGSDCDRELPESNYAVGMLVAGAAALAIGIPLTVVGEKHRRATRKMSLRAGPTGAALQLSF